MIWERRINTVSLLGLAFVAGWIGHAKYYDLDGLWGQRNYLIAQTRKLAASCEDVRQKAIAELLNQQDIFGTVPDWSKIKSCPKPPPIKK